MKVSKLISELKKYPKSLDIGISMHDNAEGEIAGIPFSVYEDIENNTNKKYVIIRC